MFNAIPDEEKRQVLGVLWDEISQRETWVSHLFNAGRTGQEAFHEKQWGLRESDYQCLQPDEKVWSKGPVVGQ